MVTLDNCEREPIHLPGRVQAHGALLVVEIATDRVVQVSENAPSFLHRDGSAEQMLGQTLQATLGAAAAATIRDLPRQGPPSVRTRGRASR